MDRASPGHYTHFSAFGTAIVRSVLPGIRVDVSDPAQSYKEITSYIGRMTMPDRPYTSNQENGREWSDSHPTRREVRDMITEHMESYIRKYDLEVQLPRHQALQSYLDNLKGKIGAAFVIITVLIPFIVLVLSHVLARKIGGVMPTMATIFTHWKSTVRGILVFVITTCGVLFSSGILNGRAAATVALISALATAYVGIISQDAGVQVASIAGGPPVAVSSHEVPDQPDAIPVSKAGK
jgi:hypothetical protein